MYENILAFQVLWQMASEFIQTVSMLFTQSAVQLW